MMAGERDRQGLKLIVEAVDMLCRMREKLEADKKDRADRETYVRGNFRVEASLPFTLDNFQILHQEATKLAEENDDLRTKVSSLTTVNFDLQSRLTRVETSYEHL